MVSPIFFYLIGTVFSAALPNVKRHTDASKIFSAGMSEVDNAVVSVFSWRSLLVFSHEVLKHISRRPTKLWHRCPLKTSRLSLYARKQILLFNTHPCHFIFVAYLVVQERFD